MKILDLYKYEGETDSKKSTIISLCRLTAPFTLMARLVADEGKMLTDGKATTAVVDAELDEVELWSETDISENIEV